jgi:hypothetical protein
MKMTHDDPETPQERERRERFEQLSPELQALMLAHLIDQFEAVQSYLTIPVSLRKQ